MKKSREKLKAELMGKAEAEIERVLDWHEKKEKPTWTEIEEEVLEIRRKIGEEISQSLVEAQERRNPVPGPRCEGCGEEMRNKGVKRKKVKSRVGEVEMERGYYYCQRCGAGIFPPG